MIEIINKKDCCGCHACSNVCPKQCITMKADDEGFLYPIVDKETCIDCLLCEKVCPVINQSEPRKPLHVYAAKNKNEEIRMQSSSGGIFTLLAENVINKGGVVYGAKFDNNWNVIHDYTETIEGLAAFRGSKYVQSTIGNTYSHAKKFLQVGREVLFSGTPCQIAGLKKFLRKEYDNLLTVDIICHGVPSPKVWSIYLNETYSKLLATRLDRNKSVDSAIHGTSKSCIETISFRSKISGWKKFSFMLKLNFPNCYEKNTGIFAETLDKNTYMRAFLCNLVLRNSCHYCPSKSGKSHSDISLGDFWSIRDFASNFDDNKGTSLVLVNTKKGCKAYNSLVDDRKETTYTQGLKGNPCIEHCVTIPEEREDFWKEFQTGDMNIANKIYKKKKATITKRILNRIKKYLKK